MGSVKRRLGQLEAHSKTRVGDEDAVIRKVMRRFTDAELRAYVDVLRRMRDGEKPVEEDGPILARAKELYEEVGNGERE